MQIFQTCLYPASNSCSDFIEGAYQHKYRDLIERIDLLSDIKGKIDLNKTPHFTTLQKFVSKIPSSLFNLLLSKTLKLFYSYREMISITVIDVTEFTSSYISYCFFRRTEKPHKYFLNIATSVNTTKKVVLGWNISQKTYIEIKHTNILIRQSNR